MTERHQIVNDRDRRTQFFRNLTFVEGQIHIRHRRSTIDNGPGNGETDRGDVAYPQNLQRTSDDGGSTRPVEVGGRKFSDKLCPTLVIKCETRSGTTDISN
ncbi:uncharacterized protein METZ01_LOCUS26745 [marine metagenome]|uniref:Uncharacterized protein n=1 Tax=marine metagenome TaxID=408172 RepID=A0A381Q3G9_9ZZZZ